MVKWNHLTHVSSGGHVWFINLCLVCELTANAKGQLITPPSLPTSQFVRPTRLCWFYNTKYVKLQDKSSWLGIKNYQTSAVNNLINLSCHPPTRSMHKPRPGTNHSRVLVTRWNLRKNMITNYHFEMPCTRCFPLSDERNAVIITN